MNRRQLLFSGLALLAPRTSSAATARIDILPMEPIGTINPNIYGHFTEHLGGCIYDGIWVGENSKIPNYGGIRKQLVDTLKRIKPPVIRWPGGCFADSYNWRDGVGPRNQRPRRTNFWASTPYLQKAPDGPQKYDPNQFGTNEFVRLCRLTGAEPYLAGNLRSLNAKDFYEWIEYCNSPAGTTTLSETRAQGGDREPLNVKYWGVGNESWGCGGNFTGDEYAIEMRRYVEWVPRFGTEPLRFIASGPNVGDYAWTRSFFQKMAEKRNSLNRIYAAALHYYCGPLHQKQANDFNNEGWYSLLSDSKRMEELIDNHWHIMTEFDPEHRVKLVVDEWGAWHETDPSIDPSYLWAYFPTLRDALVSGITLDIFNRHADKIMMANAAQMVNDIHMSILAVGEKFIVTPVFHVFEMYAAHQGGQAVRTVVGAPRLSDPAAKGIPNLMGSCSLKGKRAVLTIVNPHVDSPTEAEINVNDARITGVTATVLSSKDLRARDTFEQPHALEPVQDRNARAGSGGKTMTYAFWPASVTKLELDLA